jgi:hypothetical protein
MATLSALNINADRFIPTNKKDQWDGVPRCLIVAPPSINSSDFNILQRRSDFDKSFFNRIHYVAEDINTLAHCTQNKIPFIYIPKLRHRDFWWFMQANLTHIDNNRRNVLRIQNLMEQQLSQKHLSLQLQDRNTQRIQSISDRYYADNRAIETNAEFLAKLCDYANTMVQIGPKTNDFQIQLDMLHEHIHRVVHDYCTRLTMIMDIERLQASEDIKHYDLYSKKFDLIEIPMGDKKESCPGCMIEDFRADKYSGRDYCFYHYNLTLSQQFRDNISFLLLEKKQGPRKPSIVSTEIQFRALSHAFARGQTKLIGYMTVSGIAENRPLVIIGDFLRLRFAYDEEGKCL